MYDTVVNWNSQLTSLDRLPTGTVQKDQSNSTENRNSENPCRVNVSFIHFQLPHSIAEDIEFKGYHFPKGTSFMPNIYAVHFDPVTWPEPEVFNPSRHLTEEGKINKREELIPFSVGMLNCVITA